MIKLLNLLRKTGKKINFRLKDWGISRQRYWGCPIPIAYDDEGNYETVPEDQLPIKLPENINLKTKGNPLDHQEEWRKIKIKGKNYKLETDTLDTLWTPLGTIYDFVHQIIQHMDIILKI